MKYIVDAKYEPSEELKEYMLISGNDVPKYCVLLGVIKNDFNDGFHLLLKIPHFHGHNAGSYSNIRPDITTICRNNDCYYAPKDWVGKRLSKISGSVSIYNEVRK